MHIYYSFLITEANYPALLVACANTTTNSITVLMKETNKCTSAKVYMYVTTGSTNCLATGLNLYLCAGLQSKTTYTISAVNTTRSANGSVLKTALGTAVCTTGECDCTNSTYSYKATYLNTLIYINH